MQRDFVASSTTPIHGRVARSKWPLTTWPPTQHFTVQREQCCPTQDWALHPQAMLVSAGHLPMLALPPGGKTMRPTFQGQILLSGTFLLLLLHWSSLCLVWGLSNLLGRSLGRSCPVWRQLLETEEAPAFPGAWAAAWQLVTNEPMSQPRAAGQLRCLDTRPYLFTCSGPGPGDPFSEPPT